MKLLTNNTRVRMVQVIPRLLYDSTFLPKIGDEGTVFQSSPSPYGDGTYTVDFDEHGLVVVCGRELEEV